MKRLAASVALLFLTLSMSTFAAPEDAAAFREKLRKAMAINHEVAKLHEQLNTMREDLIAGFRSYFPAEDEPFGQYKWLCHYGGKMFAVNLHDDEDQQVAWIHAIVHDGEIDPANRGFAKQCQGYPATRFENSWVWVLVGRVELRVHATSPDLKSDEKLDELVGAFDLAGLEAL